MSGEYTHENLTLVGIHEPDTSTETAGDGTKYTVELPGVYHIGTVIDGAFIRLATIKASNLFKKVERAKQQQAAQPSEPEQPTPPAQ